MTKPFSSALLAGALLCGLAACNPSDVPAPLPAAEATEPVIEVGNAFIAVPIAGRDISMVGMDIAVSNADVRLVEIDGAVAETFELHTMAMEDGTMRMRQVEDGFAIAAGETLQLKRGGNHVMLFGVGDVLPGEAYPLQLSFEDAEGERIVVEVVAIGEAIGQ